MDQWSAERRKAFAKDVASRWEDLCCFLNIEPEDVINAMTLSRYSNNDLALKFLGIAIDRGINDILMMDALERTGYLLVRDKYF